MERQDQSPQEKTPKQRFSEGSNKQILEALKRSRITRGLFDTWFNSYRLLGYITTERGREILKDPYLRRTILQRKYRVGLLEDSIVSNNLYAPNEDKSSLENVTAEAGRMFAYNFHRRERLGVEGIPRRLWKAGRLASCLPEELSNNPPEQYTPTFYIDLYNFFDVVNLDMPPLEDFINNSLLRETTYQQAYERVGLYEKYRRFLVLAGLEDKPLYQVTPKGNGLVFLFREFGESVRKPKESAALQSAYLSP